MTTIAYKDGVIAYDSLVTAGDVVTNRRGNKKTEVDGLTFFFSGETSDKNRLIRAYKGEDVGRHVDAAAFVIDGDDLYLCAVDNEQGFWKQPIEKDNAYAIGSGSSFALTAMDMGADAVKAVEMAILRDIKSGGQVNAYRIGK